MKRFLAAALVLIFLCLNVAFAGFFGPSNFNGPFIKPTFNPGAVSGLKLWLKSDTGVTLDTSGTTSVSNWADLSGNGNNFVQATKANQPAYVTSALNGRPALRFDGSNDKLTSSYNPTGAVSIFAVVANKRLSSNMTNQVDTVFGAQESSGSFNGVHLETFNYFADATQRKVITSANGGTITNYKNTNSTMLNLSYGEYALIETTVASPVASTDTAEIGVDTGGTIFTQNDILELVVYNKVVSAGERAQVENYFNQNYRLYSQTLPTPASDWSFNEGSGSTVVDSKSVANLTINGTNSWGSGYNSADETNANRYISSANGTYYNLNDFTFVGWITLGSTGASRIMAALGTGGSSAAGNYSWYLSVGATNVLGTISDGTSITTNTITVSPSTATKYFVALTYKRTGGAADNIQATYIAADGACNSMLNASTTSGRLMQQNNTFELYSKLVSSGTAGENGDRHRWQIYNQELTQQQLLEICNAGSE